MKKVTKKELDNVVGGEWKWGEPRFRKIEDPEKETCNEYCSIGGKEDRNVCATCIWFNNRWTGPGNACGKSCFE